MARKKKSQAGEKAQVAQAIVPVLPNPALFDPNVQFQAAGLPVAETIQAREDPRIPLTPQVAADISMATAPAAGPLSGILADPNLGFSAAGLPAHQARTPLDRGAVGQVAQAVATTPPLAHPALADPNVAAQAVGIPASQAVTNPVRREQKPIELQLHRRPDGTTFLGPKTTPGKQAEVRGQAGDILGLPGFFKFRDE